MWEVQREQWRGERCSAIQGDAGVSAYCRGLSALRTRRSLSLRPLVLECDKTRPDALLPIANKLAAGLTPPTLASFKWTRVVPTGGWWDSRHVLKLFMSLLLLDGSAWGIWISWINWRRDTTGRSREKSQDVGSSLGHLLSIFFFLHHYFS